MRYRESCPARDSPFGGEWRFRRDQPSGCRRGGHSRFFDGYSNAYEDVSVVR